MRLQGRHEGSPVPLACNPEEKGSASTRNSTLQTCGIRVEIPREKGSILFLPYSVSDPLHRSVQPGAGQQCLPVAPSPGIIEGSADAATVLVCGAELPGKPGINLWLAWSHSSVHWQIPGTQTWTQATRELDCGEKSRSLMAVSSPPSLIWL